MCIRDSSNTVKTFIDQAKSGKLKPQEQPQQEQQQSDPWGQGQDQGQGQQADPWGQGQGQAVPYGYGLGIG